MSYPLSLVYYLWTPFRSVVQFLKIAQVGVYVNMARANPTLFAQPETDPALVPKNMIVKFEGKETFPVGLMALSVQASYLREPGTFGNSSIPVYKLVGIPFSQEYRRDVSLWCSLLGFDTTEVIGPVGADGITFQTKTPSKSTFSKCFLLICCFWFHYEQVRALGLPSPGTQFVCLVWTPLVQPRILSRAILTSLLILSKRLVCIFLAG